MKRHHLVGITLFGLAVFLVLMRTPTPSTPQNAQAAEPAITLVTVTPTPEAKSTNTPPTLTASPQPTLTPAALPSPTPAVTLTPRPTTAPGVTEGFTLLRAQLNSDATLKAAVCAPDWNIEAREGEVIVPMLLYHFVGRDKLEVNGESTTRYDVTLADFRTQLALFQQLGYHTVTVSDVAAAARGEGTLPERPIAITVDDGWVEQYTHIFRTLQEFDMRATFYVPSTYPVGGRFVTWEQLAEMIDAGMEIGSHTRNHVDLVDLDADKRWTQVFSSKMALEDKLGITIESISYPFGHYNMDVVAAVRNAGYTSAVALGPNLRQSDAKIFALTRVEVVGTHPLLDLVKRLPWLGQDTNLCWQPEEAEPFN